MTKQIFLIVFLGSLISISCETRKSYKYIESIKSELSFGPKRREGKPEIIKALNDSSAYFQAYERFCGILRAQDEVHASIGGPIYSIVDGFALYDDKGNDISKINFPNKLLRETEIMKRVFSFKSSTLDSLDKSFIESAEKDMKKTKVDSTKIERLEKSFRIKIDEFSNNNEKWYDHPPENWTVN